MIHGGAMAAAEKLRQYQVKTNKDNRFDIDLDFGVGTQYDSPEQALSNYGNYFTNIQGQRESAAKVVNYNQFDPSDFAREGTGGSPQAVIGVASGESLSNYITKRCISLQVMITLVLNLCLINLKVVS